LFHRIKSSKILRANYKLVLDHDAAAHRSTLENKKRDLEEYLSDAIKMKSEAEDELSDVKITVQVKEQRVWNLKLKI
jgi:hypothetical protein